MAKKNKNENTELTNEQLAKHYDQNIENLTKAIEAAKKYIANGNKIPD